MNNPSVKRHKSFQAENDTFEFYYGGTEGDAKRVKEELKRDFGLDGELNFDSLYGWTVKVRKGVRNDA